MCYGLKFQVQLIRVGLLEIQKFERNGYCIRFQPVYWLFYFFDQSIGYCTSLSSLLTIVRFQPVYWLFYVFNQSIGYSTFSTSLLARVRFQPVLFFKVR